MIVNFGAEMAKPLTSAHSSICDAWVVRASAIWAMLGLEQETVKTSVQELIKKFVRLGESEGKEVEQGREYRSTLRDTQSSMKRGGDGKVVLAAHHLKQTDNKRLLFLLIGERVTEEMHLVWVSKSEALVEEESKG